MAVPEIDRRKKESGMVGHIVETLIGKQSRKVAFGIWGFVAANALITSGKIDIPTYLKMFFTCAALIGLGTIVDEVVANFGNAVAGFAANKVKAIIETKTETTVTTDVPPIPPTPGQ